MKARILLIAALGLSLLGLTGCVNAFLGAELLDELIAEVATAANSADRTNVAGVSVATFPAGPFALATGQVVEIVFNGQIDSASLTAVTFYTLKATAAADGARDRNVALAAGTPEVFYNVSTDRTTVRWTLDLSTASASVEAVIDPTVLTAVGGTRRLDLDGDNVQGEAQDDEYINYFTVTGGTAIAGAARNPRAVFPLAGGGLSAVAGDTAINFTYSDFATDATDYRAALDAMIRLEKFNPTTLAWDAVTYVSTYSTTTGAYDLTMAATVAGEVYRLRMVRSGATWPVATLPVNGYTKKVEYEQALNHVLLAGPTAVADATYNASAALDATYVVSTVFDANGFNGYVQLNITNIGLQGIEPATVVAANVKLYDTVLGQYVPWSTAVVRQQTAGAAQLSDQIILYLNPAYKQRNFPAAGNLFDVHVGPGLIDRGATTATTDDLKMGDFTNVTNPPLGWAVLDSDTTRL